MKKLLELRQQKTEIKTQMRNLLEKADSEKRSLTDEEGTQFDELRIRAGTLDTEISRYEAIASEERNQPGHPVNENGVSNDELRTYILTGEARSLSTSIPEDGGYTVIPELNKQIMQQLNDESVMRKICTVKKIGSNEFKQLVSVGGAGVNHGEEGKARGETTTPKLEEVSIRLFPVYTYPKTTQEIIDFSGVDIMGWLSSEIGDAFVDTEEADLASGDGVKKAKGFLSYPLSPDGDKTRPFGTIQKVTVSVLNADFLIDLKFKLRAKYRKNAVWVMNSTTAASVQKLKNGNGDYIWRDRLQAGDPDTLLGLPVEYLETMPDDLIGIGDFKRGYFIVDHETGTRTRPDNITEPGFIKIHTDKYLGGGVVDSGAIKLLEISASSTK
ncbi:TPA_asm: phage major capsid protein [Salmonella enterica subsp. enterica]|uniref:Phage major capsid protein n=1 Tax=Salmonella enterica I TaxID=59201 RepID=A0A3T8WRM0_SALET|nr:phage major capsid protein [Salmonella enterica]AZT71113.1 phage major capsid protein [Salmonella enterica subsp. enterica serovar Waycross]EAA2343052.1 phage major capsid protein [Salmonella enterica subsp. enterica serovar Montevideo]EAA9121103.1 phage major capsid protein [Salmonella enterica subsp. enterica serovar Maastricht]EBP6613877.1 phage major capsid protein [Salmonella enterica subsp. enterica]HCB5750246.1 phage major capsid protein [Salmonella enterica subsp. enterica serovar W